MLGKRYKTFTNSICLHRSGLMLLMNMASKIHNKSNVIYLFKCRCGSRYVGKTTQYLENQIQHLPSATATKSSLAIGDHLLQNPDCLDKFDRSMFGIVCKARTESVLHVLGAMFIKSMKPDLCKQMEFVKVFYLFSNT